MPRACSRFHFVTSGHCWLEVGEDSRYQLNAGDFVVAPRGASHRLSSAPAMAPEASTGLSCERINERLAIFRSGGKGELTTFISGDVVFDRASADHVIAFLPKIMRVGAAQFQILEWLHCSSRLMAFESRDLRPGWESVITRLADIMIIQTIRNWIELNPSELTGWMAAFRDPAIGRAIALIHAKPAIPWTVASLAKEVAMSRSAFAESFTALVGEPVMQYLTKWRMHLASIHLSSDQKGLEEIAPLLGYQSGAAFSRAFKRFRGVSPGEARRSSELVRMQRLSGSGTFRSDPEAAGAYPVLGRARSGQFPGGFPS